MFSFIEKMRAKKARVRVIIRGIRRENIYFIQNAAQSWNLPGRIGVLRGNIINIELEGSETAIRARLNELAVSPHVIASLYPLEITWLPYTGDYAIFSVMF